MGKKLARFHFNKKAGCGGLCLSYQLCRRLKLRIMIQVSQAKRARLSLKNN
jgi:hypothetical protein